MIVESIAKKEIIFSKEEEEAFVKVSKILDDIENLADGKRLLSIRFNDTNEELEIDLDTISWYLKRFAKTALVIEQ